MLSVMNERRKHQPVCGADGSMYLHGKQRTNFQSKPFHMSRAFTLFPPRPGSYTNTGLCSRGSELMGLQGDYTLPSNLTHTFQMSAGVLLPPPAEAHQWEVDTQGDTTEQRGRRWDAQTVEQGQGKAGDRSRTGFKVQDRKPSRDDKKRKCKTPKTHCEEHARHPGAAKVNSELHLYLPSSLCEDEEQDAETEEMRPSDEELRSQDSEVKFKQSESHSPVTPADTRPTQDPVLHSTPRAPSDDITLEDSEHN
ncbi:hypothetical protein PAMP_022742 [Pampus punctatissimus]